MYKLTRDNNSIIRLTDGAHIPMAPGNRDYNEYQEWLAAGNTPEPAETEQEKATRIQMETNAEARAYLASTDWYVTRFQEIGTPIPSDVLQKRQEARDSVVEI